MDYPTALDAAAVDRVPDCAMKENDLPSTAHLKESGLSASSASDREHVLVLISHAHAPPLQPSPDLKYDVRNLPNPPKKVRDAYDGRSKRLIEWMVAEPEFVSRSERIREDILAEMTRVRSMATEAEKDDDRIQAKEEEQVEDEEEDAEEDGEEEDLESISLSVSISCAMGRHRSVSLVETLGRMSWPGWDVEIQHRDVLKKRGSTNGSRGKRSRGMRGAAMSPSSDGDSD